MTAVPPNPRNPSSTRGGPPIGKGLLQVTCNTPRRKPSPLTWTVGANPTANAVGATVSVPASNSVTVDINCNLTVPPPNNVIKVVAEKKTVVIIGFRK